LGSMDHSIDAAKCQRGFCGRKKTLVKVISNPGGHSDLNIFQAPPEQELQEANKCQTQRNKSSVFEDEDAEGPPAPPSSIVTAQSDAGDTEDTVFESNGTTTSDQASEEPCTPRIDRNKSMIFDDSPTDFKPSLRLQDPEYRPESRASANFYDPEYRSSTRVRAPPGGASTFSFG